MFSLIVLAMANNVGPSEYGSFAYAFILITYSAYIVFGTNQSIVKHFPLSKKEDEKNYFFKHGIYVTGLGLLLLFLAFVLSPDEKINALIVLISSNKLIIELSVTFCRVQEKVARINILYFCNTIPLLIFYFHFDTTSMLNFFMIWSYSTTIAALVGLIFIFSIFLKQKINLFLFENVRREQFIKTFFSGLSLAIIGFSTPFFASFDKLILSYINYDSANLGLMQFADNLAAIIALGFGSLTFILTPSMIKNLNEGVISKSEFIKQGYLIYGSATIIIILLIILIYPIFISIFPDYKILYPLIIQTLTRLSISALFMLNILVMVRSLEIIQIKSIVKSLCIFICLLILNILFFQSNYYFYAVPLCGLLSTVSLHLFLIRDNKIMDQR